MARQTRGSEILERAKRKAANLKSIDPEMAFDEERSITALTQRVESLSSKLESYNEALAMIDSAKIEIDKMEAELADLMDQLMTGVIFRYGKDSPEVQKAGGTRKSDAIAKGVATRIRNKAQKDANQTTDSNSDNNNN